MIATQELEGNPCNIGTKNWRHPDQWPMRSIMEIKLKILIKTDAMFKNCLKMEEKSVEEFTDELTYWSQSFGYIPATCYISDYKKQSG